MIFKRTIKLLKEYLRMNNISVTDTTAMPSSLERSASHLELFLTMKLKKEKI